MTDLERMLEAHMQSRATTAWRMAAGDRKQALRHLEAMCAEDQFLADGIRQAGLAAAIKAGRGDYETLVRTAGPYRAHRIED